MFFAACGVARKYPESVSPNADSPLGPQPGYEVCLEWGRHRCRGRDRHPAAGRRAIRRACPAAAYCWPASAGPGRERDDARSGSSNQRSKFFGQAHSTNFTSTRLIRTTLECPYKPHSATRPVIVAVFPWLKLRATPSSFFVRANAYGEPLDSAVWFR